MKKITLISLFIIIFSLILTVSSCNKTPTVKAFEKEGMKIILTKDFYEEESSSYTACYKSSKVTITAIKEDLSLFPSNLTTSLYAQRVLDSNELSNIPVYYDNVYKYSYFTYEINVSTHEYFYLATCYKGYDAFWLIQFGCSAQNKSELLDDLHNYSKSVSFTQLTTSSSSPSIQTSNSLNSSTNSSSTTVAPSTPSSSISSSSTTSSLASHSSLTQTQTSSHSLQSTSSTSETSSSISNSSSAKPSVVGIYKFYGMIMNGETYTLESPELSGVTCDLYVFNIKENNFLDVNIMHITASGTWELEEPNLHFNIDLDGGHVIEATLVGEFISWIDDDGNTVILSKT